MRDRSISTVLCIALLGVSGFVSGPEAGDVAFRRGDADANGALNVNDPIVTLGFLFQGSETPGCLDALDVDDDGSVVVSDPVGVLNYLFLGGPPPQPPFRDCGPDPTADALDCVSFPSCEDPVPVTFEGFTFLGVNAQGQDEYTHDQTGIVFVLLPGGDFEMGSPDDEPNRRTDEGPVHAVTLSPFLIAKHEVRQDDYAAVMAGHRTLNPNPSWFDGTTDQRRRIIDPPLDRGRLPVEQVSWDDLESDDGFLARTGLALPSEAQWEYACRGGTSTAFSFGDECFDAVGRFCEPAVDFMWYGSIDGETTHPVGEKLPNPFGLHDMNGNIHEWCEDVFDRGFYGSAEASGLDPVFTAGSGRRIGRGGSWQHPVRSCRSASRVGRHPDRRFNDLGFRPVRPLP